MAADKRFTLSVPVTNKGPAGWTTIQVYSAPDFELVGQAMPVNRLLCWSLVAVPADGQVTATISCAASDLAMWDLAVGDYVVSGGNYSLALAQFSGDPAATHSKVAVAASAFPGPGQSMRERAEKYTAEH